MTLPAADAPAAEAQATLRPLLEARSVAIVGASTRPGSFGNAVVRQVLDGGFAGSVHPVNPRYQDVEGLRCVASLTDLPKPAELALLAVGPDRVEAQLLAAADSGARAAVVYASLPEADLNARLQSVAAGAGMAVCGANCMGFVNLERSLRACAYAQPSDLRPGPVTFVSHSGSAFSAMLHSQRGVRFNLVVSAGTEFSVSMDGYLDYALGLSSTRAIGLFMETSRNPAGLRRALHRAAERDVPVVCLKVGRGARSRQLVASHTGALAGEDAAYDALFAAYGVLRVADLDEMMDTLELLTAGSRRTGPGGLAAVTDSGGERALLADMAADLSVPFAKIGDGTLGQLRGLLSPALVPDNPLDAWDALEGAEQVFTDSLLTLHDDPAVAAVALSVDLTAEESSDVGYVGVAKRVQAATSKPFLVLSHVSSAVEPHDAQRLRDAGVPVLEGTRTGLAAVRHMFAYRDARARPPVQRPEIAPAVTRRWRQRLASPAPLAASESFRLLADYGIPVAPTLPAASLPEAITAAERIGWPVALKTAAGVARKSDAGGVRLGLAGPEVLAAAYAELARSLGPRVTVSAMVPPGAELALGIVRDPQFGPLVMAGAGGVLVELLADRVFGLPPLDPVRAQDMLGRLKARRLLDGFRGTPASDVSAVEGAIVRLSALAADVGDLISGLDINPLIAGPSGCVAVDVLVARELPG